MIMTFMPMPVSMSSVCVSAVHSGRFDLELRWCLGDYYYLLSPGRSGMSRCFSSGFGSRKEKDIHLFPLYIGLLH